MIWFLIFTPTLFILYFLYKSNFDFKLYTWYEYLIPYVSTLLLIWIITSIDSMFSTTGKQYINSQVTHAVFEEAYETYVEKTCSRQVKVGENCTTDSNGNKSCTDIYETEYYDCSYCDYIPEWYYLVDNYNQTYTISKSRYYDLKKNWKSISIFKDMHRNINYHGYCGKDGDAYIILWNKNPYTSINKVKTESYENKLLSNKSLANYIEVKEDDIKNYKLFSYPKVNNISEQINVLGLDKFKNISNHDKYKFTKYIEYINGKYGPLYKVKVFVLFFKDSSPITANFQEAYWTGGNQNELVICIGLTNKGDVRWTKTFSHTYNTKILSDIRYDFQSYSKFDYKMVNTIEKNVSKFKHRNFKKDFEFVKEDQTSTTALVFLTIFILVSNFFIVKWITENDIYA